MTPCTELPLPTPASAAAVLSVLRSAEPVDVVAAAAHLMTPVDVSVGAQVRVDGGRVRWRGEEVDVTRRPWEALVSGVADMVSRARLEGDLFLPVGSDATTWLKFVRSGAYVHLAGVRELLDGPTVMLSPGISVAASRVVVGMVVRGHALVSGQMYVAGQSLAVRADARAAMVDVA